MILIYCYYRIKRQFFINSSEKYLIFFSLTEAYPFNIQYDFVFSNSVLYYYVDYARYTLVHNIISVPFKP